ncbi:hypothetical protein [Marinobacter halotolerans]|uniref:hypothetical protein n=1 Tax=Marinobacter halotolerans TaxID=1569211 RepID=UPI0012449B6F|nr:hypothetical protein [Marinobacter halotolerans]
MNDALPRNNRLYSAAGITLIAAVLITAALTLLRPEEREQTTVVPVAYARAHGAQSWDAATWQAFRQSPDNRWLLSEADLQARGDRLPGKWLPALNQCLYISRFIATVEQFDLDENKAEIRQLASQRQRCYIRFQ